MPVVTVGMAASVDLEVLEVERHSTYEDEEMSADVLQRIYSERPLSGSDECAWFSFQKNGEWYYLSSMANMGLGNNVRALEQIREAVRLEPGNQEYRMLLSRMEGGGTWYQTQHGPFGGMPSGGDDMCVKLCLANAACNLCCPGSFMCC